MKQAGRSIQHITCRRATSSWVPTIAQQWFAARGWVPFDFQRETWAAYAAGRSGLLHAPTGTGKTYAVWFGPLAEMWAEGREGEGAGAGAGCLERSDRPSGRSSLFRDPSGSTRPTRVGSCAASASASETASAPVSATVSVPETASATASVAAPSGLRVLWITPLRALANDTVEALRAPLADLGLDATVELRTGDTSAAVKTRQRRRPPTALVTTPESLSVLLSYADAPRLFARLRCVVVDEWHELIGSKRGVQTELALAALRRFASPLRTWGLSATLGNLEEAAATLLGGSAAPGAAALVAAGAPQRRISIETVRPASVDRFPWSGHLGMPLLPQVVRALGEARTTLLFTNTRSQAEIWFQALLREDGSLLGRIALHHGSLDRAVRLEVERRLRAGQLHAVVCTSSLDLGVDFPPVDQIVQIGSPKGIARVMQRAGRSGHRPGAVSRLIGVPTNALELIEFSAARQALGQGRIEPRHPVERPLDVLVQHVVTRALGGGFDADSLLAEVRSTRAYADLPDEEWRWVMDFVEKGGRTLGAYPQYCRIAAAGAWYGVPSPQVARLHRLSIGTIVSDAAVRVRFVGGRTLGTIEESFIARLRPGDRFVFAGRTLELIRVREMTAHVRPSRGGRGRVPRWMGGRSPLSTHLAAAVRERLHEAREGVWDDEEMRLVRPLLELQARWSVIPARDELLVETTRQRRSHHAFVFTLEGRLVNEGLAALAAHRLTRSRPRSIEVTANDYGFELLSAQPLEDGEAAWREALSPRRLLEDLLECVNASQLARRRFREIARVAGLVFPGFPGQAKAARHLQASSELFFDVFSEFDPENLLLEQSRREVLERELEFARLRRTLADLVRRRLVLVPTKRLTPLAFPLWAESIRSHRVSTERWLDRVQRMVLELEGAAAGVTAGRMDRAGDRVGL